MFDHHPTDNGQDSEKAKNASDLAEPRWRGSPKKANLLPSVIVTFVALIMSTMACV